MINEMHSQLTALEDSSLDAVAGGKGKYGFGFKKLDIDVTKVDVAINIEDSTILAGGDVNIGNVAVG